MSKLTRRTVEGAEPKAGKTTFLWDDSLKGFGLRVTATGAKSYIIQFRNREGQSRRLTIGKASTLTPEEARNLARLRLAEVAHGRDPSKEKRTIREAPTMKDIAVRFEEEHMVVLKPKTAGPYRRLIDNRILPTFGTRKVEEITRDEVKTWHRKMSSTPVEANRALSLLSKLFNFAEREDNPTKGIRKNKEQARERYLSGPELFRLGKAITDLEQATKRKLSPFLALAFRLILLTGMRRDEVLTLRWEYIDLDAGVIRLPDSKTGKKEVVLSTAAVDLLRRAPQLEGSPWVVSQPGRTGGEYHHVTNPMKSWARVREEASRKVEDLPDVDVTDVTLHDCRHAFASVGVGAGLSLPAIGALLGHTQAQTTKRYAHLAKDPMRLAADLIAGEIEAAMSGTEGASVHDLKDARKGKQ